jgi:hypothetical protein
MYLKIPPRSLGNFGFKYVKTIKFKACFPLFSSLSRIRTCICKADHSAYSDRIHTVHSVYSVNTYSSIMYIQQISTYCFLRYTPQNALFPSSLLFFGLPFLSSLPVFLFHLLSPPSLCAFLSLLPLPPSLSSFLSRLSFPPFFPTAPPCFHSLFIFLPFFPIYISGSYSDLSFPHFLLTFPSHLPFLLFLPLLPSPGSSFSTVIPKRLTPPPSTQCDIYHPRRDKAKWGWSAGPLVKEGVG